MAVPCAFPHTSLQGRLLRLPTRLHGLLELQLLLNATANEKVQDAESFLCGLSGIRHVGIVGLSSEHVNALSAAQMELQ